MELLGMLPRDDRFQGLIWDYPSIIVGITLFYLWFVLEAGPKFMTTRQPLNVKTIARLFNLFQVIANIWFVYNLLDIIVRNRPSGHFKFGCNPPTTVMRPVDNDEDEVALMQLGEVYLWVRISDFLDTAFFVLAKKLSHVSFLHVYHHVVVVMTLYVYLRSGWAPTIFYVGLVNSSVHIVMYSYYFLSTFASLRPYLWWKKYLTGMQILQFCVLLVQLSWVVVYNCGYPIIVCQYNIAQGVIFLTLFSRFYLKSYKSSNKSAILKSEHQ